MEIAANLAALVHSGFIFFVILGSLRSFKARFSRQFLFSAGVWVLMQQIFQIPCPLTILEAALRRQSGQVILEEGFVFYYLGRFQLGFLRERVRSLNFIFGVVVILRSRPCLAEWRFRSGIDKARTTAPV